MLRRDSVAEGRQRWQWEPKQAAARQGRDAGAVRPGGAEARLPWERAATSMLRRDSVAERRKRLQWALKAAARQGRDAAEEGSQQQMAMGLARCDGALVPAQRLARCDEVGMAPGARSADLLLLPVGWTPQEPEQMERNRQAAGMRQRAPDAQRVRVEARRTAQRVRFGVGAWPQGSGRA